jgi:anti-anti-sigma factor
MSQLCLQVARRPDVTRIAVIGRLDRHTAADFTDQIRALIHHQTAGARPIVIDLRCCIHMDAAGAAALATIQAAIANTSAELRLDGMSPLTEDAFHTLTGSSG